MTELYNKASKFNKDLVDERVVYDKQQVKPQSFMGVPSVFSQITNYFTKSNTGGSFGEQKVLSNELEEEFKDEKNEKKKDGKKKFKKNDKKEF